VIIIKRLLYSLFFLSLISAISLVSLYASKVKEAKAGEGWYEEEPYILCHNNPAQSITLEFENEEAYEGHLGLPHNEQVYDTEGACEEDFDVCPLVQECIGNEECLSELQYVCEEEGEVEGFSCNDFVEFCEVPFCTIFPNNEECQEEEEPTPTPTPTPEVPIEGPHFSQGGFICPNASPVLLPGNPLVWRNGDNAIVQWQPTGGDKANVYYREVGDPSNAHAVRDTENDGYVEIGLLGTLDWEFGIEQSSGCAGQGITWIIDGGTSGWVLFTP